MSDITSTNEETLIQLIENLEPGYYICLRPNSHIIPMIDVFVFPLWFSVEYTSEKEREQYYKASFMALALHEDVWKGELGVASNYRQ